MIRQIAKQVKSFEEIPTPRGWPLVGTSLALWKAGAGKNLHEYVDRRHKELGPIFKEKIGPVQAVFVSHPEDIRSVFAQEGKLPMHILPEAWTTYNTIFGCKRGLFFMEGEEWLFHRRILNKLLLKGDLSYLNRACQAATQVLCENLQENYRKTIFLGLEKVLNKWSIEVIVAVLLGDAFVQKNNRREFEGLVGKLTEILPRIFESTNKFTLISAKLAAKLRLKIWKEFVLSQDNALETASSLVNILLKFESNGLLSLMLQEGVTKENLHKIAVDFIVAANDTTSYSIQWLLYLLAKNEEFQIKLRRDSSLLRNTVREGLRLYPIAPFLTRILPQKSVVGGFATPPGTLIVMSIYSTGRDEKYFNKAGDFIPERWSQGTIGLQQASLPFAMGSRSCIGRKIAEIQLEKGLQMILSKFHLVDCNENAVEIVLKMVVAPSAPILLKFMPL